MHFSLFIFIFSLQTEKIEKTTYNLPQNPILLFISVLNPADTYLLSQYKSKEKKINTLYFTM